MPLVVLYEIQSVEHISQFTFHPSYLPELSVCLAYNALRPCSPILIGAM